jgi:hypothetical protein
MSTAAGTADESSDQQPNPDPEPEQAPDITVVPDSFTLVAFDATDIADIAAGLCRRIGLPTGLPIRIEVNELTPLGRARLVSVKPAVLDVESGALEAAHRPRQLSRRGSTDVLGRLLLRLRDRLDPGFGDPPDEDGLSLAQTTAWDVYAMARLARLGHPTQMPRWQYHFRLRHGFSDAVDASFARLWQAEDLTWPDLEQLSASSSTSSSQDGG